MRNRQQFWTRRGDEYRLSADEWMDWYEKLYQAVVQIATLGAGFTFTSIVGGLDEPPESDKAHVRFCMALSWLLSVISIGFGSIASLTFHLYKPQLTQEIDETFYMDIDGRYSRQMSWMLLLFPLTAQLLVIAAFLASAVAVLTYTKQIGVAALALTGCNWSLPCRRIRLAGMQCVTKWLQVEHDTLLTTS